jgi:DNA-binding HxlR family transcriptional regulator
MKPRSSNKASISKTSFKRSVCPIACALDLLGDKWTLLVVRDLLMFDKRLYSEILQSEESIPTNILADRLKRLEEAGIITKKPYQQNPVRYAYRLTSAGITLGPVLKEIAHWANKHIPCAAVIPDELMQRLVVPTKISGKRSR